MHWCIDDTNYKLITPHDEVGEHHFITGPHGVVSVLCLTQGKAVEINTDFVKCNYYLLLALELMSIIPEHAIQNKTLTVL